MQDRMLTQREKRLVVGALRMAAAETEAAERRIFGTNNAGEMRKLAKEQRALADELDDQLTHVSVRCNRMPPPDE